MNVVFGVKVLPKGDHPERSELQLRKGDQSWEGSRERNRGPMNKNRIRGGAERGERARCREHRRFKRHFAFMNRICKWLIAEILSPTHTYTPKLSLYPAQG